jgi:hypothetical protein
MVILWAAALIFLPVVVVPTLGFYLRGKSGMAWSNPFEIQLHSLRLWRFAYRRNRLTRSSCHY